MFKFKKWQIAGIAGLIIGIPAFFMFIDASCSPIKTGLCRQWLAFQWETVLAGLFGLSGGIFVIASSQQQISALREETEKTLRQAKLHRADEINAPLHLARDAVDDCLNWMNETADHIRGQQKQVESSSIGISQLNQATSNAVRDLHKRLEHMENIRDAHKTTVLNYDVYFKLGAVTQVKVSNYSDPGGHPAGDVYMPYRKYTKCFHVAYERTVAARTAIDLQIAENLTRCGVED